ncbi:MAG: right-handed parallel beta-helix repeat-containing protein [Solirubrobacteraceae bacterium]
MLGLVGLSAVAAPAWAHVQAHVRHHRRHHPRAGRTFYVSASGNDQASGRSANHAWRDVDQVDRAHLRPGDMVLFHGGETFADDTLMPGWGFGVSGAPGDPITFGSYGGSRALLPNGVWLGTSAEHPHGPSHLRFQDLALGPVEGFQGTGDYITVRGMTIGGLLPGSRSEVGVIAEGSHWVVSDNRIDRTGDSGMLLGPSAGYPGAPPGGSHYLISHNTIVDTGLDPALTFGTHGIYDKVSDATIIDNTIIGFRNDGVSARYHGARVTGNYIAHGGIGIAWYQYDRQGGTIRFARNRILDTSTVGIFVCGTAESCWRPHGHFVIANNDLTHAHGSILNLQPVLGHYTVYSNR